MDFGAIAATYGLPTAIALVLAIVIYRGWERERAEWKSREADLKTELRAERGLNDDLNAKGFEALGAVKDLTTEVKEQRPLQNEMLRQIADIGRRMDRMEGQR